VLRKTSPPLGAPRARRVAWLASAIVVAASVVSCGASLQAVYEGDVRFEHCMALDSRPDIKQPLRRTCWEEWNKFYTFGQTRDRIGYASKRVKQLDGLGDAESGAAAPVTTSAPAAAVPDPTSALAPPPMMLVTDGGVDASTGDAAADTGDAGDDARPPGTDCSLACEQTWNLCRKDCKTAPCEKTCGARYTRCVKRCF